LAAAGLVQATAKLGVLPQPFFPPPHAILEVFTDDWAKLAQSVFASIKLELLGFAVGASMASSRESGSAGRARSAIGCTRSCALIGPLPAIAWLPVLDHIHLRVERSEFIALLAPRVAANRRCCGSSRAWSRRAKANS
jgi:ABC-type nitrate/sulfonate/bicarbonate transport system permease component